MRGQNSGPIRDHAQGTLARQAESVGPRPPKQHGELIWKGQPLRGQVSETPGFGDRH